MLFWFKKFVAIWLMPFSVCLVLCVVGTALLYSARRGRLGRTLVTIAVLFLLIFSNRWVSKRLIEPLEATYPAIPDFANGAGVPAAVKACQFVVVLGGGHGDSPGLSPINRLSASARGRLMEAIRILRVLPDAKLILSGPGHPEGETHAHVLAEAAMSLGVAPERIIETDKGRDTEEEAREVRRLVGEKPFVLVTSAWHMRRAAALMRGAGLHALPAPSDYLSHPSEIFEIVALGWDADSLERSKWFIHEQLGLWWSELRHRAD